MLPTSRVSRAAVAESRGGGHVRRWYHLSFWSLVAHCCCDPCRATQCRAHSVAANPADLEMSQGCRATPLQPSQKDPVAPILPPLCQCRGEISLQKWIALHGGVAATLTPTALHCATKFWSFILWFCYFFPVSVQIPVMRPDLMLVHFPFFIGILVALRPWNPEGAICPFATQTSLINFHSAQRARAGALPAFFRAEG